MKPIKITSIGEILFDIYPDSKKLGGAPFNFIYHIWKITGKGNFISRIGNDYLGAEISSFLSETGFDSNLIQVDQKHTTGTVQVELDKNKTPKFNITTDTAYDKIELNDSIEQIFEKETNLLYYGTLAQRDKISRNTIQSLWKREKKYFCDINLRENYYSKETIYDCLDSCDVLKINNDELNLISELENLTDINLIDRGKLLLKKFNLDLLSITRGSDGALLLNNDKISEYQFTPEKIVDTVGAGDAYSAILCIGYLSGWDLDKINIAATKFAADICGINGALPEDDNFYNKYKDKILHEN